MSPNACLAQPLLSAPQVDSLVCTLRRLVRHRTRPNLIHVSAAVGMVGCIVNTHRLREWIGDAFGVLDEVLGDYEALVKCFLGTQEDRVRDKIAKEFEDSRLWPRPGLALNRACEPGTVNKLVYRGVMHPMTRDTFRARASEDDSGEETTFHGHQTDAFDITNRRKSYTLTTGSGSVKSTAYILPIIDRVHVRQQVQGGAHG
jgi:ATP-dependent helicase YprA (DUF1998 family)